MTKEINLRVLPQEAYNEQSIMAYLQKNEGIKAQAIRVLKRSIDARQRTIYVNLTVRIFINEEPDELLYTPVEYHDVSDCPEVIVVGAGPGGLFAALRLIELGLRPIVIERGKDVHERKKDLARIRPEQRVDPESNYSFGEGGAGAYSDGKLYTRSKKRGNSDRILNIFVQHGASPNILVDAHPHIGTDRLPRVIENMRNTILKCGGEVHFQTKMTGLVIKDNKIVGAEAIDNSIPDNTPKLSTNKRSCNPCHWSLRPRCLSLVCQQQYRDRGQGNSRRRTTGAPIHAYRPNTVSQQAGTRKMVTCCRIQHGTAG